MLPVKSRIKRSAIARADHGCSVNEWTQSAYYVDVQTLQFNRNGLRYALVIVALDDTQQLDNFHGYIFQQSGEVFIFLT